MEFDKHKKSKGRSNTSLYNVYFKPLPKIDKEIVTVIKVLNIF